MVSVQRLIDQWVCVQGVHVCSRGKCSGNTCVCPLHFKRHHIESYPSGTAQNEQNNKPMNDLSGARGPD